MKTDMPHKELEQFMEDNMDRVKKYSVHEFYMLYKSILNRDGLIENYSLMSETSFIKRIGEWSKPGKWLIKKGRGKKAIYYKRVVHRSVISAADLKKRANEIINCVKRRLPWGK